MLYGGVGGLVILLYVELVGYVGGTLVFPYDGPVVEL